MSCIPRSSSENRKLARESQSSGKSGSNVAWQLCSRHITVSSISRSPTAASRLRHLSMIRSASGSLKSFVSVTSRTRVSPLRAGGGSLRRLGPDRNISGCVSPEPPVARRRRRRGPEGTFGNAAQEQLLHSRRVDVSIPSAAALSFQSSSFRNAAFRIPSPTSAGKVNS